MHNFEQNPVFIQMVNNSIFPIKNRFFFQLIWEKINCLELPFLSLQIRIQPIVVTNENLVILYKTTKKWQWADKILFGLDSASQ